MRQPVLPARRFGPRPLCPSQRIQALDEHQPADDAQEHDIGQLDQQIDLPDGLQRVEDLHAQCRAYETADQQDRAHPQIDRLAPEMRQRAREGRGDDLVRLRRDGDRRWNTDEEQKRRHQKTAAHPEHARQHADKPAQPEKQERVDGNLGNGEVNLHGVSLTPVLGLCSTTKSQRRMMPDATNRNMSLDDFAEWTVRDLTAKLVAWPNRRSFSKVICCVTSQ